MSVCKTGRLALLKQRANAGAVKSVSPIHGHSVWLGVVLACDAPRISRRSYHYQPKSVANSDIIDALLCPSR